jgi:hypothetical protein
MRRLSLSRSAGLIALAASIGMTGADARAPRAFSPPAHADKLGTTPEFANQGDAATSERTAVLAERAENTAKPPPPPPCADLEPSAFRPYVESLDAETRRLASVATGLVASEVSCSALHAQGLCMYPKVRLACARSCGACGVHPELHHRELQAGVGQCAYLMMTASSGSDWDHDNGAIWQRTYLNSGSPYYSHVSGGASFLSSLVLCFQNPDWVIADYVGSTNLWAKVYTGARGINTLIRATGWLDWDGSAFSAVDIVVACAPAPPPPPPFSPLPPSPPQPPFSPPLLFRTLPLGAHCAREEAANAEETRLTHVIISS